jgi:Protein of unknown function (DUF1549)/Protein of unknown function (DUF1553)/Bacterial Ig-like domain (group 2)
MLTKVGQLGHRRQERGLRKDCNQRRIPILLCLLLCCSPEITLRGADKELSPTAIDCLPTQVNLFGQGAKHSLVVTARLAGGGVADFTRQVKFESLNPDVVVISRSGELSGVKDGVGRVKIQASPALTATVEVHVEGMEVAKPPSFRNEVMPALTKMGCNQGACHGSQFGKGGFKLSLLAFDPEADYDAIVKDLKGRRIQFSALTESLILRKPTLSIPHGGGQRFGVGSPVYDLLLSWIASGTPGPRPDDPVFSGLKVLPASRIMKQKEQQQVMVLANYSDGRTRDVTQSSRLESLNDSVAEVSNQGLITARGGGQAAILARYMGNVAMVEVVVPYAMSQDYSDFRAQNYVDELVLNKWKQLSLQPARLSSDTQFLRRVYLDLIGTLPTEEEVIGFVTDTGPDKRSKTIDRLLERPEYVDFWVLKWGDLLRVTRNGMGAKGMWKFHSWLRSNIQANRPIDQMVREILLARGQPNSYGPAAFYRIPESAEELAETVSQTFMGLRLGCAKCHQHPFENLSQNDYYGMAAFFARLDLKGDRNYGHMGRSTTLRLKPTGFVRHPKTQKPVPPAVLGEKTFSYDGDPREKLADWLTARDNPWFAKNLVNRYWGYMMGRGLVMPLDDLRKTNPASIPELMDALEKDFISHGFDQKHILRTIVNSRVYQLDSEPPHASPSENQFYTYYTVKRLSAEQLLEAIDFVTNTPDKFDGLPEGTRPIQLPDPEVNSYFLNTFGRPNRKVVGEATRNNETNVTQVLHLMNSDYLQQKLSAPSGRVATLIKLLPTAQIVPNIYYATLARPPSKEEYRQAMEFLAECDSADSKKKVVEDLLWTLLNSREFLFNH